MTEPRAAQPAACCADCRHFNGSASYLEAALPGLSSLSSAYASVRSADGICALHDRYVAATSACRDHAIPGAVRADIRAS